MCRFSVVSATVRFAERQGGLEMTRTSEEQAALDRFSNTYRIGQLEFMLEIERSVCGCDYGGTSWTTKTEAQEVIDVLKLGPGREYLEVGAGSGWPGLYLAQQSGCNVTLTDLPFNGLQIARKRAAADQLAGRCGVVSADGAALPFRKGSFDAIYHSDVLCCLVEKLEVLRSCRRVAGGSGRMVFSVIFIAPGLGAGDRERAIAGGPPFVDAPAPYPEMLGEAGWEIVGRIDLTAEYLESTRRHVSGLETYKREVIEAYGEDRASEMLDHRRNTVSALEAGLLRRELFNTVPAVH